MQTTKIRIVFHKLQHEEPIGYGIVGLTWLYALFYNWKALKYNFTHVEVWLPDNNVAEESGDGAYIYATPKFEIGNEYRTYGLYLGRCFSSTTRGGAKGVRFAPASEVLDHPERWKYIEVEVDAAKLQTVIQLAEDLALKKLKYDFLGILGFLNPFPVQDKRKWYCSELVNWFLSLCRLKMKRSYGVWVRDIVMKPSKRISPRRMAAILAKKFHEPLELK